MKGNTDNKIAKPLSVFAIVAINIIAVDSLRTLPFGAHYGFSLTFFYLIAGVLFFIPVSLVAAELATGWPETGGIYVWVREAFGLRAGFLTIWLQWIYNVTWYPTILAFVASTFAYLISPQLSESKPFLFCLITTIFWATTIINCLGMKVSSFVSSVGAIVGTILPMLLIIVLAFYWLSIGKPTYLVVSWQTFFPNMQGGIQEWVFFSAVLYGLVGMEMSAIHAGEVKNPQRDYPIALFYSTVIIFASLLLGSLAIAMVIPQQKLNLMTGLMEAFEAFFNAYHMGWFMPVVAILIILGAICSVSTWVIGPAKGMMVASIDKVIPKILSKKNRYGAPYCLLITQALIFTVLSLLFVFVDNLNESYWLLSDLTSQLALLSYVMMFAAAIWLRAKHKHVRRVFRVPGPDWFFYLVCSCGLFTSLSVIVLGFVPPSHIPIHNIFFYEAFLVGGLLIFVGFPLLYSMISTRSPRRNGA